jgi:transposase-like protein
MPTKQCDASALAPLLDGSTAGELIPELVRQGLQQLIEQEVAAVLGAERHERTDERLGYRNVPVQARAVSCASPATGGLGRRLFLSPRF